MAGFLNKVQNLIFKPTDDEYDDEYYDDIVEEEPVSSPSARRSERVQEPQEEPSPSLFRRQNKVVTMKAQLQVLVFKPMSFGEDTRDIADALMEKSAVVLNLERTPKEESRRIIDFLSGVAYANNGKIKRIATSTYMITPYNVDLSGEDLFDEFENSGVYF